MGTTAHTNNWEFAGLELRAVLCSPGSPGSPSCPGTCLLFKTATDTLRGAFRTRLKPPPRTHSLPPPSTPLADYVLFHPHLHILAADGLFGKEDRFHCMPAENLATVTELFRHRFLHALRDGKHLSARKVADPLTWKHSGFHIDSGGEKPVAPHDTAGRKRLAKYLLRAPFSLQKITWNPDTKTVKSISETAALSSWNTPETPAHGSKQPAETTQKPAVKKILGKAAGGFMLKNIENSL